MGRCALNRKQFWRFRWHGPHRWQLDSIQPSRVERRCIVTYTCECGNETAQEVPTENSLALRGFPMGEIREHLLRVGPWYPPEGVVIPWRGRYPEATAAASARGVSRGGFVNINADPAYPPPPPPPRPPAPPA